MASDVCTGCKKPIEDEEPVLSPLGQFHRACLRRDYAHPPPATVDMPIALTQCDEGEAKLHVAKARAPSPFNAETGLYESTGPWEGCCRLCGDRHPVTHDCSGSEHQRLADAASKLIEAIYPDFVGDLPAALEALAEAIDPATELHYHHDMLEALRKVSRI